MVVKPIKNIEFFGSLIVLQQNEHTTNAMAAQSIHLAFVLFFAGKFLFGLIEHNLMEYTFSEDYRSFYVGSKAMVSRNSRCIELGNRNSVE